MTAPTPLQRIALWAFNAGAALYAFFLARWTIIILAALFIWLAGDDL